MIDNETLYETYQAFLHKKEIECRASYFEFVKYMWDVICQKPFQYNFHIEKICNKLQKITYNQLKGIPNRPLAVNISPGETKTILFSQMWNAWDWLHDPSIRFLGSSHTDSLSTGNAMSTKDIITSEKFIETFGLIELKDDMSGKSDFMTSKRGRRKATSVQSKVMGTHYEKIIFDDPSDWEQEQSAADLKKTFGHMRKCFTRKADSKTTFIGLIQQRTGYNDATSFFLEELKEYNPEHWVLPAEDRFTIKPAYLKKYYQGGVMNPSRKPMEVLNLLKKDENYDTIYGQNPLKKEGKTLSKKDFVYVTKSDLPAEFFLVKPTLICDPAYTANEKSDPSGILIASYFQNILYLHAYYEEHMELPEIIQFIDKLMRRHNCSMAVMENKASGMSIAQTARKIKGINVMDYNPGIRDKEARFNADAVPQVKGSRVAIIIDENTRQGLEYFVHCVSQFPENSIRDEAVDTLSMACKLSDNSKTRTWQV